MNLHMKSKIVSIHDKMEIFDDSETVQYRVASKAFSIHDKTRIENAAGEEVAYIHAKPLSIHHQYFVEMADGTSFSLKEELSHLKDYVDIAELGWQLRGKNVLAFDFCMYDANDQVLATAHRKYVSLHGLYDLVVVDESKVDEIVAIFVIMKHLIEQREDAASTSTVSSGN